jgi:iron complex outermembrane recepter protein
MKKCWVAILAVFALGAPASAQQQTASRDTSLVRLPAVRVIAARSEIRAIDMPLAVSIVGKREFENTNGHRIDEALRAVPGVLAQSRYGGSDVRITIRGFGARGAGDRSNAGTTRGVRILQDGFPETEPDGRTALDLVDLAATHSVEVMRSNAGSLWGNAAGGVVNFTSVPTAASPRVSAEYMTGSFGLNRAVVQTNSDIGSGKFFVTGVNTEVQGYRVHSDALRRLVNVGLSAPVGDRTALNASLIAADNQFNIPGPLTLAQFTAHPDSANATYLSRRERRRNRIGRLGVEVAHSFSDKQSISAMAFVNPKYLQRSERGTFRDFTRYHVGGNVIYQAQHSLGGAAASFSAGADEAYQDGAILFYGLTPTGNRATDLRDNKREGANNFGVFAQEMLSRGRFDLTLGARYDAITYYSDSYIRPQLNDEKSFTRVTPKLGLAFHPKSDHTLYANVGGGVEAPAGNETDPASTFGQDTITSLNPLLEPIRSTTFEVGDKALLSFGDGFLRGLSYDIAFYQTNVTNEIVPYRGGRFYFTAAKAVRRGAEFGLRASTAPGVAVQAALTLSDHKYKEYQVDSVHYNSRLAGHFADFSDNKVVGVPDRMVTLVVDFAPSFARLFTVSAELQNIGDYFADDANLVSVPGYSLYHGTIALRTPVQVGHFSVRGYLRAENLADKKYVASSFLNPDVVGGLPVAFEPGLPRHVVLAVSVGLGHP